MSGCAQIGRTNIGLNLGISMPVVRLEEGRMHETNIPESEPEDLYPRHPI